MTFHFPICEGHSISGEAREFLFFSFEDRSRPESIASIRHLADALQDFGDTAALCENDGLCHQCRHQRGAFGWRAG